MAPPDIPPIANRPLYIYRVAMKWVSFFIFGLGTILLAVVIFPVLRLCIHSREKFRVRARYAVFLSFRFFTKIMELLGIVKLEVDDREFFRRLNSKIIVANHPSLLDVVFLISLVPNADCIVRGALSHTILQGVIRQLYIPNSLDFEDLMAACINSLNQGNNIIFFPEGTRTPRTGEINLKKGASRLALGSGRSIIPVYIGGNDKYGLGKRDPWTAFNRREKYLYHIRRGAELFPETYGAVPAFRAIRQLTDDIRIFFVSAKNSEEGHENIP
ncbi:MAG: 1-acyl-sn-glycerol-3-phosphate acyltransferase [Spirochaetaceae bacterium]|jgi:1-acyl-sn-glycerol-3-phosphate acyltransferase|nr:1-acyl-sn-glycerol-3-phosphate acyltransferase [Spirochaetaceae bacterium]